MIILDGSFMHSHAPPRAFLLICDSQRPIASENCGIRRQNERKHSCFKVKYLKKKSYSLSKTDRQLLRNSLTG